jgi:hypothetical protein
MEYRLEGDGIIRLRHGEPFLYLRDQGINRYSVFVVKPGSVDLRELQAFFQCQAKEGRCCRTHDWVRIPDALSDFETSSSHQNLIAENLGHLFDTREICRRSFLSPSRCHPRRGHKNWHRHIGTRRMQPAKLLSVLAPQVGLEPTTLRLTASISVWSNYFVCFA